MHKSIKYTFYFLSLASLLTYLILTTNLGYIITHEQAKSIPESDVKNQPPEGIFTALQVTDMHLSVYTHTERIQHFQAIFKLFENVTSSEQQQNLPPNSTNQTQKNSSQASSSFYENGLKINSHSINQNFPINLILITGDMTDGRAKNYYQGQQIELEWRSYNQTITKLLSQTGNRLPVIDLRGNHDVYGSFNSTLYQKYGISGVEFEINRFMIDSNQTLISTGAESQSQSCFDFFPIDAVPLPGVSRPLNFIGYVKPDLASALEKYNPNACSLNIFYSHYPMSTIYGIQHKVAMSEKANLFLSGHLHEATNASPRNLHARSLIPKISELYAMHRFGQFYLPEFELGDFRDHRRFRLITINNGIFNFKDFDYSDEIEAKLIVSIINPQKSWQAIPRKSINNVNATSYSQNSNFIQLAVYGMNITQHCIDSMQVADRNDSAATAELVSISGQNQGPNFAGPYGLVRMIYQIYWDPKSLTKPKNLEFIASCYQNQVKSLSDTDATMFYPAGEKSQDLNSYTSFAAKLVLLSNFCVGSVVTFFLLNLACLTYLFSIYRKHFVIKNSPRRIKLWYALLIFNVWLMLGPWFFGKFIDQRIKYDPVKNRNVLDTDSDNIYGILFSFGMVLVNWQKNLWSGEMVTGGGQIFLF